MFDVVRNNRRFVQLFLVLITLPFAFWGVESYIRDAGSGSDVATVGSLKISPQEFQQALREQQEQLRARLGRNLPPNALDSPEVRKGVLENMITEKLLALQAKDARLNIPDQLLAQILTSAPDFQEEGKFSTARYKAFVASQNMSEQAFEARLRSRMITQQTLAAIGPSVWGGHGAQDRWIAAQLEQREVVSASIDPASFVGQVKLDENAAKTFYDTNRRLFELPEQAKVEYVVLARQQLAAQVAPSDADIKKWYDDHIASLKQPEERRASHILIAAGKDSPEAERKAAKAKADSLLVELKKNPKSFAALAKQNSQDPGSATQGGDLGWFKRGMMTKPFEDATFALKEGELSEVVQSDYGYHLILLSGIHGEKVKPLAEVKNEAVAALKEEMGQKKFAESSEGFTNTVYEQADSLKPAAEKYRLEIKPAGWVVKGASQAGVLSHPKLMAALFSDDAIKNGRNTEAVEVAPGVLVSARVVEHKEAALRPFDELKNDIIKKLTRDEAVKLAAKAGEAALEKLRKGEPVADLKWGSAQTLGRNGSKEVSPAAVKAVFQADVSSLPAYAGSSGADGRYELYRINQVKAQSAPAAEGQLAAMRNQYDRVVAGEEVGAWLAEVRKRFPVEINEKLLEARER